MPSIDRALWILTAIASATVLFRLWQQQLLRQSPYTSLAVLLGVTLARDAVLTTVSYSTHTYAIVWELTLPILLLAHAAAAVATYRAIAKLYPRIGPVAIGLFIGCLGVAALGCCIGLPFEIDRIGDNEATLRSAFMLYRWIDSLAAGALVLAIGVLARFPAPLRKVPRNLSLHTILLCSYFSAYSITCFVKNLLPLDAAVWLERSHFGLVAVLYAGWAWGLSAAGQKSERWRRIDPAVSELIEERNRAALGLLRYVADK